MTEFEDAELLRRYAREQSQPAFAELVRRHLDLVYAAALRRTDGDGPLAEDVSQQVFVALARHARALQRHPTLAGWLYRTTRYLAANALRSERARKLREQAHAMHDRNNAPEPAPDWGEIRPHLDELIEQLDDAGRDAVVRRFFSGQKFAEMSAALHVSEDAARMRVERALDRLRTQLARRGVTSTTAALGALLTGLPAGAAPAGLAATVTTAAATVAPLATPVAMIATLHLMNTTKLSVVTWSAAALLTLGGVYFTQEANTARDQLDTLVRNNTLARAALFAPPAAIVATPAAAPAKTAVSRTAAPATVQPFVPVRLPEDEIDALKARERALSPEMKRERAIMSNRIRVRIQFHAIYAMLGLSREQIDRFETLAAAKGLSYGNVIATKEQMEDFRRFEDRTTERIVAEALGSEFVRPFLDYLRTIDLRTIAGELASNTYYTEAPLTSAQAERLIQLCVEHRTPDRGFPRIDVSEVEWPAVLARAGEFLAPVQLQALRAGLAKKLFDIEYERATKLPLRRPIHGL